MSAMRAAPTASRIIVQRQIWAIPAGAAMPNERKCCGRSNGGGEPILPNAAVVTSVRFPVPIPRETDKLQSWSENGYTLTMRKQKRSINVQDHILPDGTMSSEFKDFLTDALAAMKANAVAHKQPPWAAFPEYERHSMGWRMGPGEDYWHAFHSWIRSLEGPEADEFVSAHPEPENWTGFYDSIGFDG
jgi:hypothetical protein